MAQRTWLVRPDHEVQTLDSNQMEGEVICAVSQQALAKAVLDGVVMLDRAGGVLSVTVSRAPTGVPGERVTTGAMVEWKDRTDARPQAEQDGPPVAPTGGTSVGHPPPPVARPNGPMPISVTAEQEMPAVDERDVPPELRGT